MPPPTHTPSFGLPPYMPASPAPMLGGPSQRHAAPPPPMGSATASPAPAPAPHPPHPQQPSLTDPGEAETGPPPYGPGAIIGDKYRLIRVIGRGGMGAVWVAHNIALDVEVAIKLMRRDRATPEAAARFTTEARAAARLGHPSIVRVFDFGETSRGDPFIVMELLHGESFGALLNRKKKLSATVAVQTLLPVAHALAAAHAKGIVHRDLKPDNILLAKDETGVVTPKLVDFGIAKLVSTDPDRHFTIAGEVLGSPDYMSPEQARGEDDIDERSDIWTFCVLLYEAIVGRRPFDGSNYNALLAAIIATRPVSMMEAGVNEPGLWSILEKGLSKERDGRWQSARELGKELAYWATEHGAETDLVGTSISAQWLEPTRKRLFTVAGSQPSGASEGEQAKSPNIPKPPPLGGLAAEVPKPAAPAISNTMPPFSPRRRPWVTLSVAVLVLAGAAYGLLHFGFFESPAAPIASAPASAPTAAPSQTTTDAPSADASTPAPTSSAKPSTSAKTRPTAAPSAGKPRAPQVKGNIKF
jgi:serine/threonine-protein kinase